jgi:histidyl-tRNA synthetase
LLTADPPPASRPVALVPIGAAAETRTLLLAEELRHAGLVVEQSVRGNLSRRMKRADRINARFAIIVGEDELAAGAATVRDLDSGEQQSVAFDQLADFLSRHE